jgi:hypothetical protein
LPSGSGPRIIRVFSYWRTTEPERATIGSRKRCALADEAAAAACIIGSRTSMRATSAPATRRRDCSRRSTSRVEAGLGSGQCVDPRRDPFPTATAAAASRIAHVHAKDCFVKDHKPVWGAMGEMGIDWRGQIDALRRDGYTRWISLETHWTGPNGDKFEASTICGRN